MAGQGFPRRLRLLRRTQFQHVFQQPCKAGENGLTVLARVNDLGHPRLGLVVSRRCAASAVQRNRIKRRAREAFRHLQSVLGAVDIVVIGRPGLSDKPHQELSRMLARRLLEAVARCKPS